MKPTTVTPESMLADGQALTQVAEQMGSDLTGLGGTIQGAGYPWGSDEQGSIFGQVYLFVLGKAFESIASHLQQVGYAGQALIAQASGYADVESGNTQQLSSLSGGLE